MTNLEAIQAKVNNYPIDDATFQVALIESGLNPTDEFKGGKAFDLGMVKLIVSLLTSASRISEGGYTVELDMTALRELLNYYLNLWGWRNPMTPRLKDGSFKW